MFPTNPVLLLFLLRRVAGWIVAVVVVVVVLTLTGIIMSVVYCSLTTSGLGRARPHPSSKPNVD